VPALADENAAAGGVATIDRALSILAAFDAAQPVRTLAELAARTRVAKSTLLRMLASLVHARMLQRRDDGAWSLGPETARLAAVYTASFSLEAVLLPPMRALARRTRESVAFHVRQGDQRLVLLRIDSPQLLRDHVRTGDLLPLNRGAGGRVLSAYAGARGRLYEKTRREGFVQLEGDRVPGLMGISAPVWNGEHQLVGALTLTAPALRHKPSFVDELRQAARRLSAALGAGEP
jgi:DNA-binding IclR family transcriptional regulator